MQKTYTAQTKHLPIKKFSTNPQDTIFCFPLCVTLFASSKVTFTPLLKAHDDTYLILYFCNLWVKALEEWSITSTVPVHSTEGFKMIQLDLPWEESLLDLQNESLLLIDLGSFILK